jgi:hypothetical protein
MTGLENFLAEYELSEDTLELIVKKPFHPYDKFTVEGEKYLKRSDSVYRDYLDNEVSSSKEAIEYAWQSLETYQVKIMEEELLAAKQYTAAEIYARDRSFKPSVFGPSHAEYIKRAYAFKVTKLEDPPAVQTTRNVQPEAAITFNRDRPSIHVESAEKFDFLVTSTRYTILNMLNEFVYWKPFQDKYLSMWMKSFGAALNDAGYKTPSEFFAKHPDIFVVSSVDNQRILKIKDATDEELENMLDLYKEIARTRFFEIDEYGKKIPVSIEVDDRMQFRNVFYS